MKSYMILLVLAGLLLTLGCIQEQPVEQEPSTMYICDDGKTVVSSLAECPKVDTGYQECAGMPLESTGYYDESPRDTCFYSLAIVRENISLCNKILSSDEYYEYTRAACGAKVALLKGAPAECEKLLTKMDTVDCYSAYAYDTDDISVCSMLKSTDDKDECMYEFVGYYNTPPGGWSICEQLTDEDYKNSCYYYAADDTLDLSYCDKMSDKYSSIYWMKSECYDNIASQKNDPTICEGLSDEEDRDDCYYEYATDYPYHMEVCDYITSKYIKSDCIDWTNDTDYY